MRIETIIHVESGETHILRRLDEVYNLIGGWTLPPEDQKPFGRVRGNAFTLEDLDRISELVDAEAGRSIPVIFTSPKVQAHHEAAIQSARRQARAIYQDALYQMGLALEADLDAERLAG